MIIACTLLYALSVSLSVRAPALILASLLPLILVIKRPEMMSRNLLKLNVFNLVMIITLALTWPEVWEGLKMGVIIALRVNMIYITFGGLVFTMTDSEIYESLTLLGLPEKLLVLMLLTLRGVNIMRERLESALLSLKLRAPELTGIMKLKTFGYITASVLLQSESRSERMSMAITCRGGFDGFNQSESRRVSLQDTMTLGGFALYTLAIIILNYA